MSTNKPSFRQAKHTLEIFDQQGISEADMRLLHDGFLSDFLEGVRHPSFGCLPTRDELRVFLGLLPRDPVMFVDYDISLEDMVVVGHYDRFVDRNGSVRMCPDTKAEKGKKQVKIKLLEHAEGNLKLEKNEAAGIAGKRFRLASWREILTFGATYPKVQLRCLPGRGIFGRAYGDGAFHPNLWGNDGERGLSLQAGGLYCNPGTHFLFVER